MAEPFSLDRAPTSPERRRRRRAKAVAAVVLYAVIAIPLTMSPGVGQTAGLTSETVATGLNYPSMFTFAPDGRIFYSEVATGRIGVLSAGGGSDATYFQVPGICGWGMFGVALHPDFPHDPGVYAYATRKGASGSCENQVLRIAPGAGGELAMTVLLSDPYVGGHVGGRLLFGPDRHLYVATGDGASGLSTSDAERLQRKTAQDPSSLKGKIPRVTASGGAAPGNPTNSPVFAYGFRNVFGLAFDPSGGRLWATDNGPDPSYDDDPRGPGPSGGCNDEVNVVLAGANYGWGDTGNCGTPPDPPYNTNRDGPNPVIPQVNLVAASGITGAAFCSGCGLGAEYEGRLLYVDYDSRDGMGEIRAATLSGDRSSVASDISVYRVPGRSPLSIERGPDGALYYSDSNSIRRLVTTTSATTTTTTTSPPSGGTTAPLVTSFTPTDLRRNFDGWVGMQVRVGAEDVRVSSVGRWVVSGNRDSHTVKLVDAATGADVPGGSATVATAGAPAGAFAYAPLPAAVTLRANTTYYLVSLEKDGGDEWYNIDTRVVTPGWASVPGYVYSWAGSPTAWNPGGSANQGFGPLSLLATR